MDPRGQCCSTPVYLPGGWEVRWDTTAGRPYYLDHNTKQTSWDRPAPPPDLHDQLPRPRQIQAILPTGWEERRDLGSDEAGSPHEDATDDEDDLDDELAAMSENDEPLRKKYGRRNVTQHPAIVAAAAAATAAAAKGTQCPVVRGGLAVRTTAHVQLAHVRRKLTAVKQCIADAGPVYPTGWLNAQQAKGKCWLQNPGNLAGLSAVLVAVCACACWAADLRSVFVAGYNKMMDAITSVWPEAPFYHRARLKNTVGPLMDHVPVCQVRLRRGTHKQGGCLGGFEWMWFADPGPIWDDDCLADMLAKLMPVLDGKKGSRPMQTPKHRKPRARDVRCPDTGREGEVQSLTACCRAAAAVTIFCRATAAAGHLTMCRRSVLCATLYQREHDLRGDHFLEPLLDERFGASGHVD